MTSGLLLAAVMVAATVLVGGLELGLGVLTPLVARGRDRDAVAASVGRPWLAGALWCTLTFALLVSGIPLSLEVLPALWPALVAMLAGLALRGVASSVRSRVLRRDLCDLLSGLGSLSAVAAQGLVLGWFAHAAPFRSAAAVGGAASLVSVWGLLGAAGVTGAYSLLAAGWLVWAERGAPRVFGREVGHSAVVLTLGVAALSLIWAALVEVTGSTPHPGWPHATVVSALAVLVFAAGGLAWRGLWGRRPAEPFVCAVVLVLATLACAIVVLWSAPLFGGADASTADGLFPDYLGFGLLLGSPLVVAPVLRARRRLRGADAGQPSGWDDPASHAGRRPASMANRLHLS